MKDLKLGRIKAHADKLIVIDDGASRWVAERSKALKWLADHENVRTGRMSLRGRRFAAAMSESEYDEFSRAVPCIAATHGAGGYWPGDQHELVEALLDAGAMTLFIAAEDAELD